MSLHPAGRCVCNRAAKEAAMKVLSPIASRLDHIICPFCESGLLVSRGPGFARCDSCGLPLLGSALGSLRDIVDLPDALASTPASAAIPRCGGCPTGCSTV